MTEENKCEAQAEGGVEQATTPTTNYPNPYIPPNIWLVYKRIAVIKGMRSGSSVINAVGKFLAPLVGVDIKEK